MVAPAQPPLPRRPSLSLSLPLSLIPTTLLLSVISFSVSLPCVYTHTLVAPLDVACGALFLSLGVLSRFGCALEFVYVLVGTSQVELGWVWVGLDAWKPWTTLGRLVGFPPRLSARIEAHRHGSNVGTTAAA